MLMLTLADLTAEAIEKYKLDPARVERAAEIAAKPTAIYNAKCEAGEFDVRGSKNGWHHVNTKTKTCTCPDSAIRGQVCKHRIAVWLFVEIRARIHAEARRTDPETIKKELGYS